MSSSMLRQSVESKAEIGCFADECARTLGSWNGLNQHMRRTHDAVPIEWERCETCGQLFTINDCDETYRVNCSYECRGQAQSEDFVGKGNPAWTDYEGEYGEGWDEIRGVVRSRDGFRCRWCGTHESELEEELCVHHLHPKKMFDDTNQANDPRNLMSVCRRCHQKIESSITLKMRQGEVKMPEGKMRVEALESIEENFHQGQTPEEAYVL